MSVMLYALFTAPLIVLVGVAARRRTVEATGPALAVGHPIDHQDPVANVDAA